jgi:DNA-3-methyladenine glycosylase
MIILPKSFYTHDDVVSIAKQLLGKVLSCEIDGNTILSRIVETEAYQGPEDKASHSWNNKRSPKNEAMYAEGGVSYIYISYGMHHMLNVVTSSRDKGHAVLIRAVEPITNIDLIKQRRSVSNDNYILTGGPGKICQALSITKKHNLIPFYKENSILKIYDDKFSVPEIITTPRVGMSIHVKEAANWPYRFYISDNKYVSKPLKLFYNFD